MTAVLESFVGEMTLHEFCKRADCKVEDLVAYCLGNGGRKTTAPTAKAPATAKTKAKTKAKAPRARASSGKVDTRTKDGRNAFDARILELLSAAPEGTSARDIARATGADLAQIRASVSRLASAKKAYFKGATRSRRYWAS